MIERRAGPRSALPVQERIFIIGVVLLAFGVRLAALYEVPPGWRDDELINIYAISAQVLRGDFPLYFTDASGHEPMYHYLQAGLNGLAGYSVLSEHVLSIFWGTLAIPLLFVLARRLFGRWVAVMAAVALALSFWSLMYSRVGERHISLPPFVLAAFFLLWLPLTAERKGVLRRSIALGVVLGGSVYVYPAARLLPVVVVVFGLYLALFHRERFREVRDGWVLALGIAVVLILPLAAAIAQGSSAAAAQGIGADARLVELARPVRALREGDPGPLLESIWTTLGMFHATGDPEWLYNIPHRPVMNLFGGVLLWGGVALCLYRWRQPRYFFLVLWLGFGILPTVLSVPPASLSHSIVVQPLVYLLPALFLVEIHRWLLRQAGQRRRQAAALGRYLLPALAVLAVSTNGVRDLRDYFIVWPNEDMVGFLYRADYRAAARYLDGQPELLDAAIGSTLFGPWDRLALAKDLRREDVRVRLFNPERALLLPTDSNGTGAPRREPVIMITRFPRLNPALAGLLAEPLHGRDNGLDIYGPPTALAEPLGSSTASGLFSNGLELVGAAWPAGGPEPGRESTLWLVWQVARPLELPPTPIVANPPPVGVYSGPRLAVFTHVLDADGNMVAGDDGLWVDPTTLLPGDRFQQLHRFTLPAQAPPGPYQLEVGLYDPFTADRWLVVEAAGEPPVDRLVLPVPALGARGR